MACPFLKEAQVKYCRTATVRKLIPLAQGLGTDEKCASAAHTGCKVFQMQPDPESASGPCPYLRESLMQYCGAAPVPKFVPYSESLLSRCGNDGFRYCELYLSMAHPVTPSDEAVPTPNWLRFSENHMWLDVTDDGTCHAGIDAFLARALGSVEQLEYVWQKGRHRPTALLRSGGVDFEVVFPNRLLLTGCNLYLRANPARITAEPYTTGWLFEGIPLPETTAALKQGAAARQWMDSELHRINQFLQEQTGTACDGGLFSEALVRRLDRGPMLALFHEFFSAEAGKKDDN